MSDPAGQENDTMTTTAVDGKADATEAEPTSEADQSEQDQKLQEILDEATLSGETPNQVIHLKSRKGFLTIDPSQTEWTPVQLTALKSIDIETEGRDAVPRPYVLQFLYVCQIRDLDPLLREAYLITHGNWWQKDNGQWVDSRKFTLVIGIEGFRKRAEDTGEYRGQTDAEWCGADGVWKDFWNPAWGNPVMARVGILRAGFDMPVYGKAAFDEFCPMVPEYVGKGKARRKTDRMVPAPMWVKMGINQIAKCAEAQGFRKAFPRQMNGLYAEEEMDRAKVEYAEQTRDRQEAEAQQRRMEAYTANQAKNKPAPAGDVIEAEVVDDPAPSASGQEPVSARDAVKETVAQMRSPERAVPAQDQRSPGRPSASAQDRLTWLSAELRMLSAVIGLRIELLVKRQVSALGKPVEQFSTDELQRTIDSLRPAGVRKLREAGRDTEADTYEQVPQGSAVPVHVLLGQPEPERAQGRQIDPFHPHLYVDAGGVCRDCERFDDDPIHAPRVS